MIHHPDSISMPNADTVDYCNVDEVCAYGLLLGKVYECEGGFNLPAKATRDIRQQCRIWLREVKELIDSILMGIATYANSGNIPRLIQSYDFMYRIGHSVPTYDYLREVKLRTADRWAEGDRSITRTDVTLMLLSETDRDIRTLDERYAEFAIGEMTSWVEELIKHGGFKDIPLAETYRRLAYLLNADLTAYFGRKEEAKAKSRWVSTHTLTADQIHALDTDTLWSYAGFVESLPFSTPQEHDRRASMLTWILSTLASRTTLHPYSILHPYTAQAIALALTHRPVLTA